LAIRKAEVGRLAIDSSCTVIVSAGYPNGGPGHFKDVQLELLGHFVRGSSPELARIQMSVRNVT
jgi:hypothetical protein